MLWRRPSVFGYEARRRVCVETETEDRMRFELDRCGDGGLWDVLVCREYRLR